MYSTEIANSNTKKLSRMSQGPGTTKGRVKDPRQLRDESKTRDNLATSQGPGTTWVRVKDPGQLRDELRTREESRAQE